MTANQKQAAASYAKAESIAFPTSSMVKSIKVDKPMGLMFISFVKAPATTYVYQVDQKIMENMLAECGSPAGSIGKYVHRVLKNFEVGSYGTADLVE